MIAKVALKAVSGLDLEVSDFLNAFKEDMGEAVADRLDEEDLHRVVLGQDVAGTEMQGTSKASYAALKKFMEKEEKERKKHAKPGDDYVDFKNEMKRVADGKGGVVWVSNGNAQRWLDSHQLSTLP